MTDEHPPHPDRKGPDLDRSYDQLKYLWGMVYPDVLVGMQRLYASRGRECPATDVRMIATALKRMFLGSHDDVLGLEMVPSTPKGKKELSEYIDNVGLWCAEVGIYVRKPGEPEEKE